MKEAVGEEVVLFNIFNGCREQVYVVALIT